MRPLVDWYKHDLDDASPIVTTSTLLRDYARKASTPRIYQAWIPLWLLSERLWEEVDRANYRDWPLYDKQGVFPPLKVEIEAVVGDSMSFKLVLHIKDGNHRVRFWKECGFKDAPAWCFDYRE